jgi:uncharacterized membrane protein
MDEPRDQRLDRLLFLTDGIYAIAMTLLAVELVSGSTDNLSGSELAEELWDRRNEVLAYVTSFLFVGNFWVGQLMLFRHIRRFDGRLLWLVLAQLLLVAFMPFPTAIIGRHSSEQAAQVFYFGTLTLTAWTLAALWWYATAGRRLVDADISAAVIRQQHRASLSIAGAFSLLTIVVGVGFGEVVPGLLLGYLIAMVGVVMGVVVRDPDLGS